MPEKTNIPLLPEELRLPAATMLWGLLLTLSPSQEEELTEEQQKLNYALWQLNQQISKYNGEDLIKFTEDASLLLDELDAFVSSCREALKNIS